MGYIAGLNSVWAEFVRGSIHEWEKGLDLRQRVDISDAWIQGKKDVEPDLAPKELVLVNARNSIPDLFVSIDGLCVISETMKGLLSSFLGTLPQFVPICVKLKNGDQPFGPRFSMNVLHYDECIDDGSSAVTVEQIPDFPGGQSWKIMDIKRVKLKPNCPRGAHIVRPARYKGALVLSDELGDQIKAKNLKLKLYKTL